MNNNKKALLRQSFFVVIDRVIVFGGDRCYVFNKILINSAIILMTKFVK